ncbi:DUF4397 domain-containing protein [uncultured Cyclobacterium sp.]|uniref:DUF4397 domain-containing protein n=1 Tax=uncultured Cyclobacterium sp. TaxID=453820 RepID=UPI0030EB210A|tara:strand:+ start:169946 stop:170692 length:747 start_codon:yes stop_codon:yes gene_type:complete
MNAKINNLKKWPRLRGKQFLMLLMIPFTFSCLDVNDDDLNQSPNTPTAYVSFYNGTNATADIKIKVDSTVYDRKPFDFGNYIDYWYFYTGDRNFSFIDIESGQSVLDTAVKLEVEKVYSFFMAEKEDDFTTLFVEDSLELPVSGKALVRLVHLASDGPEVTLYQRDKEDAIIEGLPYMEITDFINVDHGETDLILKSPGNDLDELVRLNDVNLREGRIYTLVVRGKVQAASNSSEALRIQLIRNYPNY